MLYCRGAIVAKLKKGPRIQKVRSVRDKKTTPIERIFKEVVGSKMNRAERLAFSGRHKKK
jgi:hypothetical protein